jgi:endonuclease/exonuclease/phosphatase family metal-dependent hydrolase
VITVMTFNIRYDADADGPHAWRYRRDLVCATIRGHSPDVIGVQEPMPHQWDDLSRALPELSRFSAAAESQDVESVGGFFRTSRFEPREGGTFWLSDTPAVPHSITWPNDYGARLCHWVKMRDRLTQRELVFACTHFDTNALSSLPSAKVLHGELDAVAGTAPLVVVGDFNCPAGSDAHKYLLQEAGFRDTWTEAGHQDAGIATFNGFDPAARLPAEIAGEFDNYRIDWILIRGALACSAAAIDRRHEDGLPPSDHFPLVATIDWD